MSRITDTARDFWDRISPRERSLVVLLVIATPITLALWLGSSIVDGLDGMEKHNDRARKALVAVETMRAKGESKAPVDDAIATMGTEPLSLDTYITNAAKKAKIDFKSGISPPRAQTRNGFVTNSSSTQVDKLDIGEVKDFLNALETDSKVVAVTHLELHRDFHEKEKLSLNLEISAYSKEPPKTGSDDAGSAGGSAAKASH